MRMPINELMKSVNCKKWPSGWAEIYDAAMDDFDKNGCELVESDYYDRIGNKYNILVKHRNIYKKAAVEIGKSYPLTAFLALLVFALKDRSMAMKYAEELEPPKSPDGKYNIAYDMLTALAMCSLAPICHQKLSALNLPEDVILSIMRNPENGVDEFSMRNGGAYGYHLLHWYQLDIDANLYRIGNLIFEINCTFSANAVVFESADGEHIVLADTTETDQCWIGFPYDRCGNKSKKEITLSKLDWKKIISSGDPTVALHIPAKCDFSKEALDKALEDGKEFLKKYFPDYSYKAITCHSWLLDPQLEDLLGENSNIVRFGKRFQRIPIKSDGTDVYYFVFKKPFGVTDIGDITPSTRLEKALCDHFAQGKKIYELKGYFI